MITKKDLLISVIRYIKEEVIPGITDVKFKMVISAFLYMVDAKPAIVDPFFENLVVRMMIPETDGKYDVSCIIDVLNKLCDEYGKIPITVPPIRFVTNTEHVLSFGKGDVSRLKEYLDLMEEKKIDA